MIMYIVALHTCHSSKQCNRRSYKLGLWSPFDMNVNVQVVLRKFKWKDCKNPPGMKIASIVDQEGFRDNIVFVTGVNGRLYQYNKVTHLWHQHYQSVHLVLSTSSGTAMRPSMTSLRGSLFMLSEDGGLVEYQWSPMEGWNWIEHGSPRTNVTLVGAPGPCFGGSQLFLIGSDGSTYLRYLDRGEWKWRNCGFPYDGNIKCSDRDFGDDIKRNSHADKYCNPKVRHIHFVTVWFLRVTFLFPFCR